MARPATKTKHAISFRFRSDRFGASTEPRDYVEFARHTNDAIKAWASTIDALFGEVGVALRCASAARILPTYPAWSSIDTFQKAVARWLDGLESAKNKGRD